MLYCAGSEPPDVKDAIGKTAAVAASNFMVAGYRAARASKRASNLLNPDLDSVLASIRAAEPA